MKSPIGATVFLLSLWFSPCNGGSVLETSVVEENGTQHPANEMKMSLADSIGPATLIPEAVTASSEGIEEGETGSTVKSLWSESITNLRSPFNQYSRCLTENFSLDTDKTKFCNRHTRCEAIIDEFFNVSDNEFKIPTENNLVPVSINLNSAKCGNLAATIMRPTIPTINLTFLNIISRLRVYMQNKCPIKDHDFINFIEANLLMGSSSIFEDAFSKVGMGSSISGATTYTQIIPVDEEKIGYFFQSVGILNRILTTFVAFRYRHPQIIKFLDTGCRSKTLCTYVLGYILSDEIQNFKKNLITSKNDPTKVFFKELGSKKIKRISEKVGAVWHNIVQEKLRYYYAEVCQDGGDESNEISS